MAKNREKCNKIADFSSFLAILMRILHYKMTVPGVWSGFSASAKSAKCTVAD